MFHPTAVFLLTNWICITRKEQSNGRARCRLQGTKRYRFMFRRAIMRPARWQCTASPLAVKAWISADIRSSCKIRSELTPMGEKYMAARTSDISIVDPAGKNKPYFAFCAEASVLHANLKQPLEKEIKPQAFVKLPKDGQYQFRQADPFHFEGILSYKSGYTQVAGHPSL